MEENSPSSAFVSETAMVKCRFCQTTLRKKNYKSHLKNIHPKQDCEDLSGKDQLKISSMFFKGNSSKKSKADVDSVVENTSVENILLPDQTRPDDAVDEEGDFAASASRKRKAIDDGNEGGRKRFESGDSAFSEAFGVRGDEADHNCPSNDKLTQILQELQEVKTELRELKKPKQSHEEIKESAMDEPKAEEENALMLLNYCRSVEELSTIGFQYDEEDSKLKCVLCDLSGSSESLKCRGLFSFSSSEQSSFTAKEKLSKNFTNLKGAVRKHIMQSKSHCVNLEQENEKHAAKCEMESKNRKAGLNLGLAAMKNYLLGRPYTDYENDVLLMKKSGGFDGGVEPFQEISCQF